MLACVLRFYPLWTNLDVHIRMGTVFFFVIKIQTFFFFLIKNKCNVRAEGSTFFAACDNDIENTFLNSLINDKQTKKKSWEKKMLSRLGQLAM